MYVCDREGVNNKFRSIRKSSERERDVKERKERRYKWDVIWYFVTLCIVAWHGISLKCLLLILLLSLLLLLLLQYICYVNAGPSNATSIINQATQVILDNLFFLLFIVYSHSLLFLSSSSIISFRSSSQSFRVSHFHSLVSHFFFVLVSFQFSLQLHRHIQFYFLLCDFFLLYWFIRLCCAFCLCHSFLDGGDCFLFDATSIAWIVSKC